jgi:hypothetical protein
LLWQRAKKLFFILPDEYHDKFPGKRHCNLQDILQNNHMPTGDDMFGIAE